MTRKKDTKTAEDKTEILEDTVPENTDEVVEALAETPAPRPSRKPKPKEEPAVKNSKTVPKPEGQCVPLKVFLQVCGQKPDQMAGFKYRATKEKMADRSIPEWHKAYNDFLTKPIK